MSKDAISSSNKTDNLDRRNSSANSEDKGEGMEVNSRELEPSNVANSFSASSMDGTSVKNVGGGEVSSRNEKECESMDVDAHSNASDIECLGDENEDEEEDEEDEELLNDEPKPTGSSADKGQAKASGDSIGSGGSGGANRSIELIDSSLDTSDAKMCEENGSVGSDIEEITEGGKSNGHNSSSDSLKDTPKKKNKKAVDLSNITPRRSSRNVNRKSYMERELGTKVISVCILNALTL